MLFGCRGDLLIHALNGRDRARNTAQGFACTTGEFNAAVGQGATAVHAAGGLPGAALQALNQRFNLLCGFLRTLRQAAHLVGNHRKTASCFTGPGGLNGGIERQQVGLLGDRLDDIEHAANLVAFTLEVVHGLGGLPHFNRQFLDLGNCLADHFVTLAGLLVGDNGSF